MTGQPGQHGGIAKDNRKFMFGYLKQDLRGGIYHLIMEIGVQFIKDLFDGNEKVCGKNYLRY